MIIRFDGDEPIYRQTYLAIRTAILEGRLRPGERLPSSRTLARDNGISRNVVLLAYEQLVAEGYAESRVGAGTFVARMLPEALLHAVDVSSPHAARPGGGTAARHTNGTSRTPQRRAQTVGDRARVTETPIRLSLRGRRLATYDMSWCWSEGQGHGERCRYDFRYGMAMPDDASLSAWRRVMARHVADPPLDYGNPLGLPELREALATHVGRSRGVVTTPDQIVVVSGSQQALDLVARVLLDEGDGVVVEEPCYAGAREAFRTAGARLLPIRTDDDGLDIERAPDAADGARLAYVTPSHQFPTGAVMPLARRLKLLEWAHRTNACVIEDDYDSEYRYEGRPIEAIQALDPEGRTIYVGTLSKVLFPALRMGFLVLPSSLTSVFAAAKWMDDRHTPTLTQAALASFIDEGHFERHLRRMRTRHAARREALIAALAEHLGDAAHVSGTNAGIHLVVWLPDLPLTRVPELIERAGQRDVGLYDVKSHYAEPPARAGFLFGYGSMEVPEIIEGVRRFAGIAEEMRAGTRAEIR